MHSGNIKTSTHNDTVGMHSENIKTSTHNDTVGTLETLVWGKPAKRGALLGFQREVIAV